jgi:hypothetical protein
MEDSEFERLSKEAIEQERVYGMHTKEEIDLAVERLSSQAMPDYGPSLSCVKKVRADRAERRALTIYDKWLRVTGVFVPDTSYDCEVQGIIRDAVHCGIQAAMGIHEPLESEQED